MKKKIAQWIKEGKTDEEIAILIMQEEEAKGLDAKKIADMISEQKKAEDVIAALSAKAAADKEVADKKAAEDDIAKRISDGINEKLKSLKIDPAGNMARKQKQLMRFDHKTLQFKEVVTPTEVYVGFNDMLKAISVKDFNRAQSISNEIDQDNKAANDPSVTDVVGRGGYAVPTEVDSEIMQLLYVNSVMLQLCNTDNLIYDSKIYPLMYGLSIADIADQTTAVTESQATFTSPTVSMKRAGAYSNIANTLILKKGADVVNAFVMAYGSEFAQFLDLRLAVGNVTTQADLVDGIVFDANTTLATEVALAALTIDNLTTIKNQLSNKAGQFSWVGNRLVKDKIGLLENTAGNLQFPNYIQNGQIAPFGGQFVLNSCIPSVLDVSADTRLTGADNVLICADFTKIVAGVSLDTRIDTSEHWRFSNDVLTIRGIKEYGIKVMSGTSTGGIVAVALALTA